MDANDESKVPVNRLEAERFCCEPSSQTRAFAQGRGVGGSKNVRGAYRGAAEFIIVNVRSCFFLVSSSTNLPSTTPSSLSTNGCRISHEARCRLDARCIRCFQAHFCDRRQAELCFARAALAPRTPDPAPAASVLQTLIRRCFHTQEERFPRLPLGVESHLPFCYCRFGLHWLWHLPEQNPR